MKHFEIIVLIFALFVLPSLSFGEGAIEVYPLPEGIAPSDKYRVEIIHNNTVIPSPVYVTSDKKDNRYYNAKRKTSYTMFSFSSIVKVRVTLKQGNESVANCRIRPSAKQIQWERIGSKSIEFLIQTPQDLSIEINGIDHPLLLFAHPLMESPGFRDENTLVLQPEEVNRLRDGELADLINQSSKRVIYFTPGVYRINRLILQRGDRELFISGGAYLKGCIFGDPEKPIENLTIRGRGIISGEQWTKTDDMDYNLVEFRRASKHRRISIEGIICVDAPHFNFRLQGPECTIRDCKAIGWYGSTDAFTTGRKGLIERGFSKVNDDAVKTFPSGIVVRNCIVWVQENGGAFQMGWNIETDESGSLVEDCDVIHVQHGQNDSNNRGVFLALNAGAGHLGHYIFRNIRIEGDVERLFKLTLIHHPWDQDVSPPYIYGRISKLRFENISLEGRQKRPSVIAGNSTDTGGKIYKIEDVDFVNMSIWGKPVLNASNEFCIDSKTTFNIQFH